jgi:polyprenyl-phospho-N-acetylgalactosaminyl synthase
MRRTCVLVPAHNEEPVIAEVVRSVASLGCTVVVIDDGSSDGTYAACLPLPVILLRHACNLGQGGALATGIAYALRKLDVDYVVTFDADGQHSPDDVLTLVGALASNGVDVALGTRFLRKADAHNIPRGRRLMLRAAVVFTRLTTGLKVTDTHNGLRAFSVSAARHLNLTQAGMAHASEILSLIHKNDLRWCEVPVSIHYSDYSRGKGQGSLNSVNIVWDALTGRLR